jgi:hypothetical protein
MSIKLILLVSADMDDIVHLGNPSSRLFDLMVVEFVCVDFVTNKSILKEWHIMCHYTAEEFCGETKEQLRRKNMALIYKMLEGEGIPCYSVVSIGFNV